jgi:hypothetical protein
MLSIDFSNLKNERPQFSRSWDLLELWRREHQDARVISPTAVVQFVKHETPISWEDATQLLIALELLADWGYLRRQFAVQAPSGQLLHPYYGSRAAIPKRVKDQFGEGLNTEEAEISPVFVGAADDE